MLTVSYIVLSAVILGVLTVLYALRNTALVRGMFSSFINYIYRTSKSDVLLGILRFLVTPNTKKILEKLPHVDSVEKVSDRVYRILGQNPGYHTLQGTNTYLVTGTETDEHILIDTGEAWTSKAYTDVLFNEVFPVTNTKRLRSIILTHGHGDHQGGVIAILTVLRDRNMLPLPLIYKRNVVKGRYPTKGFESISIDDHQLFPVDQETTLQAVFTPGHTDDHVSLILREDGAIFTGDCVLGCGTSVFDDLAEYMQSLEKLKALILIEGPNGQPVVTSIYPG